MCGRLDRIYVSAALLPYSTSHTISRAPVADHCPVSCILLGCLPTSAGRQRRRVRLGFLSSPALCQQLGEWLAAHPAPYDPAALVLWWAGFKRLLAATCTALHPPARRSVVRQHGPARSSTLWLPAGKLGTRGP